MSQNDIDNQTVTCNERKGNCNNEDIQGKLNHQLTDRLIIFFSSLARERGREENNIYLITTWCNLFTNI